MPVAPFVPLRVFSSYSLLEGAIDPAGIARLAKERGFPAIAICDRNGLFGTSAFASACREQGVQPLVGALVGLARAHGPSEGQDIIDAIALFAKDETGWLNLSRLVSAAHLDRPLDRPPHVDLARLAAHGEGLIALTGAGEGGVTRLAAGGHVEAAQALLQQLGDIFPGRLYVELARRGHAIEEQAEPVLLDLAYALDLPLVATNPASYADPSMHAAHDALLCIGHSTQIDAEERVRSAPQDWVKSAPMMAELFADLPEALTNTAVIAQRCAIAPPRRKPILPSLAGDRQAEEARLAKDAREGLQMRLAPYGALSSEQHQAYLDRLEFEIGVINRMGFAGYFLIVADFIKWAKAQGIPVGPGRGSGAGSLVAWALTITDLDPIRLGLLFERFLNPERVSMPDFDIDFCETRRGEVIRYVQQRYGAEKVAQIITFGKLKARMVLRDCGRILQMPHGKVDRLCKMVPNHPTDPWTLERTLAAAPDFRREYEADPEVRRMVDLARRLEGLPRNFSTHAAGVVIGDRPLADLVPLYRDPRSDMPVTQFDMKHVEEAGLVKFDFLGLKTLSVLRKAVDLLAERGIAVDLGALHWDDPAVFELLQRGDTVGVFQLESDGMRRTLAAVRPTRFEDIVALVSLYRPGPMDNIPLFGLRKNGEAAIEYPHPKLATILEETYGIFVYQEQVMQAAQILAGYSLGDADLLRRAMGKKKKEEMDAQRQRFIDGCREVSGIDADEANALFDLIDRFAGYGFNKSHAAAYAVLSYQTAWLKAHYPHEFYAASMCFEIDSSEKLAVFVDDMRRAGVTLLGPCLNASRADFRVEVGEEGLAVRYALAGVRNVGEKAMEAITAERDAGGPFASLADLVDRLPEGVLNRRMLECLAGAGAFDAIEPDRALVFANAERLLAHAEARSRERSSGQAGLFAAANEAATLRLAPAEPWNMARRLAAEREAFGFHFSGHPLAEHRLVAAAHGARSHATIMASASNAEPGTRQQAVLAAMVENASRARTRRGTMMVRLHLSDESGQFECACFDEQLVDQCLRWAQEGACVLLTVEVETVSAEEAPRLRLKAGRALAELERSTRLRLELELHDAQAIGPLRQALVQGPGGQGEVLVRVMLEDGAGPLLLLGRDFELHGILADQLAMISGLENIALTPLVRPAGLRLVA